MITTLAPVFYTRIPFAEAAKIVNDPSFPIRSLYAQNLLNGVQCLSGADLKGNARKYGASYARMRARVLAVALRYGWTSDLDASQRGKRLWCRAAKAEGGAS